MFRVWRVWLGVAVLTPVALFGVVVAAPQIEAVSQTQTEESPGFELDPSWPRPLPNNWALGAVWDVAVDSRDHVFILHAPGRYLEEIAKAGRVVAPPVIEFDSEGNLVRAWGGPGPGYSWMQPSDKPFPIGGPGEHGLTVDQHDNVWVTGTGDVALKFTHDGTFLLQIGELNKTNGSNDPRWLGNPADLAVDPKTNELYVADGYVNQRIVVFDADTGEYRRHWGAYGKRPDDGPIEKFAGANEPGSFGYVAPTTLAGVREVDLDGTPPQRFFPAHGVAISKDGLVYVADRGHNRVQVFRPDGTFVTEAFIEKEAQGLGSVSSVALSPSSTDPGQVYLYVGKYGREWIRTHQNRVVILRRADLQVLGSFESAGNHYVALDSKGNIFTCGSPEMDRVRLPQKFVLKHMPKRAGR